MAELPTAQFVNLAARIAGAGLGLGDSAVSTLKPILPNGVHDVLKDYVERGQRVEDVFLATKIDSTESMRALQRLAVPATRHYLLESSRGQDSWVANPRNRSQIDLGINRNDFDKIDKLYRKRVKRQWLADEDIDWSINVDPMNPERQLFPLHLLPVYGHPAFEKRTPNQKQDVAYSFLAWSMSQFYYGEQGARLISAQLTTAVPWESARLMAAAQVQDEARHADVMAWYIVDKLERQFPVDPNLMVILDSLVNSSEWDIKFLGMQILIEGLALGSFATIREASQEPLLRDMLKLVIQDEAAHVSFGLHALEKLYAEELTEAERRDRKELAVLFSYLMYNRFLGDDIRQNFFPEIGRREWNQIVRESPIMEKYRQRVFKRIINDLVRIGLIDVENRGQVEQLYEELGLLSLYDGRSTDRLTTDELVGD